RPLTVAGHLTARRDPAHERDAQGTLRLVIVADGSRYRDVDRQRAAEHAAGLAAVVHGQHRNADGIEEALVRRGERAVEEPPERCARSMNSARSSTSGAARIESRHKKSILICIL